MKKLICIILGLFLFTCSYGQAIINRSGPANTVQDARWMSQYNAFLPRYNDTTAANLQKGIDSCGAIIFTYDIAALWFRSCSNGSKQWVQILPAGSPTPGGQAWVNPINVNLFTDASLNASIGTFGANGMYWKTNNTTRLYLDRNGIAPETGTSVGIGIDPADSNRITYFSGGGGVNIYNSNGTLTNDRTLDGDNRSLLFDNVGSFTVNTSIGTQTGLLIDGVQTIIYSPDNTRYINVNNTATGIVGLTNLSTQTRLIGQDGANSAIGYITIGTGLSLSSGVLSATSIATPTWQQTLTAGSTLTQSNDITGAFAFSFTDPTSFTINKSGTARLQINTGTSSLRTSGGNAVLLLSSGTANLTGNTSVTLQSSNSEVDIYPDSILINPPIGFLKIDTINNETFQNTLMGWTSTSGTNRGKVGYITIGSGLSLSSGTLSSNGSANLTSTYIGYGSGSNTLTGDANLTYTAASSAVALDSGYLSFTGNKDFGSSVTGSIFKNSLYGLTFRGVPGASYDLLFFSQGGSTLFANPTGTTQMGTVGDWGFGLLGSTISAKVHITAGTASAGTAPLKFNQGTNLTSPEAGAMEWNGTNLFITQTTGPTRQTIAYASDLTFWNLNGTSTLTGPVTIDGSSNDYDLKGNRSGINIASRLTTVGDYAVAGTGTRIIIDESNDKLFMISAAISGATTGDALTVVDPSTGEIGVAPNLAFMLKKDNTDMYTSNGRIFVKDASGNRTQISPHNDKGEWIYRSTDKDGVTTEINMIHLSELLEKITGEKTYIQNKRMMRRLFVIIIPLLPLFLHGQLLTSVTQIATYNNPYSQLLFVNDTVRGGNFMPYSGGDPVDNGMIFGDALGRKWLRQTSLEDDIINIQWYGAKSDGVVDNRPMFYAAMAYSKKHPQFRTIYLPVDSIVTENINKYYFSDSILIDISLNIKGDGSFKNPQTKIQFPANKSGFVFKYPVGATAAFPTIENLRIDGIPATPINTSKHAIWSSVIIKVENVIVDAFDGDGLHISACGLQPSGDNNNYGNSSMSVIRNSDFHYCNNGVFVEGCDANTILFENVDASQNRRWGVFDNGFLGNTYTKPHFAFNGAAVPNAKTVVKYNDVYYAALPNHDGYFGDATDSNYNKRPDTTVGTYWQVVGTMTESGTWQPNTRYYSGGAICIKNPNAWTEIRSPYTEGFQPPIYLNYRSKVDGGDNGAGVGGLGAWWNMYAGQQILMNADLYVDKNTTVNGTLTATNIVGNGAGITGISASASFASITGQPTDNTNLSTALSAKQDVLGNNSVTNSMLAGSIATSKISNYTGYSINVQALTSSPADGATVYFGTLPKAPVTAAGNSKIYIRKACTLKIAEIYCFSGTAGTNESWSLYVRVNNTTDNLIATVSSSASERIFSNTGLNISLNAGDYIEIKGVQPTWATNPLTTIYGGYLYFE